MPVLATCSVPPGRLGVRTKLLAGFLAVALFAAVLGGYAVVTIERLSTSQRTVYADVFGGTHLLASWLDRSWETRLNVLEYAVTADADKRASMRAQMAAQDAELERLAQQMDEADTDREDVQTLAQLIDCWRAYTSWRDAAIATSEAANDRGALLEAYDTEGEPLSRQLDAAIDDFLTKKHEVGGRLELAGELSYDEARRIAMGLALGAVGVAVVVGFFLSRRVAGAAGQVAAAAQGLARGELEQRIEVHSRDELGEMAAAFREMIDYQQEMARVANAIARGDLSQEIEPKSSGDVLGTAFKQMSSNLRLLVGQLEDAVVRAEELLRAKERDARTIQQHVAELSRLLDQNEMLHERLQRSAGRTTALNEQALRRIGADLHDGPGQALAFALLRLEALAEREAEIEHVKGAVQDALGEIRAISSGLRLPELSELPIGDVLARAVRDHERRSGTQVKLTALGLAVEVPLPVKIAAFRALQEALSNATRHGRGAEVQAKAWVARQQLCLTVSDRGPGFDLSAAQRSGRLGLASMRERAELLGGRFYVESSPLGTAVHLRWPLASTGRGTATLNALFGADDEPLVADELLSVG